MNDVSLFSTPGIRLLTNVAATPNRRLYLFNDELYVFNSTNVYKVASTGVVTNIGTIDGGERVSIADNGLVMAIVVPETGNGWFSDGTTVIAISDVDFAKPARTVAYIDGTFVFNNDNELFVSSVYARNNGMDFDSLDFGTAEIDPDPIIAVHNIRNQLYAVGRHTIEIFRNIGGEGFPFQRIPGANINKGTVSRFGSIPFNNGIAFVGSNRYEGLSIWYAGNNMINKISTPAIDILLSGLTEEEAQTIHLFTYSQDGGVFLLLELPTTTFVYDAANSTIAQIPLWHERKSLSNSTRWRFNDSVRAYGDTLFGDSTGGNIGILDSNISTEYDEVPLRTATGSYLQNEGTALFIDELELVGKAGVGDALALPNPNPQVSLSWSDDGGHTFTVPTSRGMGTKDNYKARAIWRRIGRVDRSRIFKIDWQEPKAFAANVLWIKGSPGI